MAKSFRSRVDDVLLGWSFPVMAIVGAVITSWFLYRIVTREPSKYLQAPIEACRSTYTGQQKTEQYTTYQCAAYDEKMNCTVQVPITNDVTYQEVNNQCNWNEWR